MIKFPFTHQYDSMDCGAACINMLTKFHGKEVNFKLLPIVRTINAAS